MSKQEDDNPLRQLGFENFGDHLCEDRPPVAVSEERLRDFFHKKLTGDDRQEVIWLLAEYRSWHDAAIKIAKEVSQEAEIHKKRGLIEVWDQTSWRSKRFLAAGMALAASVVVIAAWIYTPSPRFVAQLTDLDRFVGVTNSGDIHLEQGYEYDSKNEIEQVLRGQLPWPVTADFLGYKPPIPVRSQVDAEVPLLSPVNTAVVSQTPLLKWDGVSGTDTYEVQLFSTQNNRVTTAQVQATQYQVEMALDRGQTYRWRVKALGPPEPETIIYGRFRIASEEDVVRAERVESKMHASPLMSLIEYCHLGMFDRAGEQLDRLKQSNADDSLIDELQSLLARQRERVANKAVDK